MYHVTSAVSLNSFAREGSASVRKHLSPVRFVVLPLVCQPPQKMTTPSPANPYVAAAALVGKKILATPTSSLAPRAAFAADHAAFLLSRGSCARPRTVGGTAIDDYALLVATLARGGARAVFEARGFKEIARTLLIPATCASAATVLRQYYADQLSGYEEMLVFGRGGAKEGRRKKEIRASALARQAVHKDAILRRRRGVSAAALTGRQQALVAELVGQARGVSTPFNAASSVDRERLVAALKCPDSTEISWALGVLNVHSYDARNSFQAKAYPGLLEALHRLLALHLDDVLRRRVFGVTAAMEIADPRAPRYASMAAALVREAGDPMTGGAAGTGLDFGGGDDGRAPTLQRHGAIFNCKDAMAVDREQWATVTVNVLRNMSYADRNALAIAQSQALLAMTAEMLTTFQVASTLRMGIMDTWINIAPYMNVSKGHAGGVVLDTCIRLLDPFLSGADYSRFANAGEVLARLAASPERNEAPIVDRFDDLLPPILDMLGGRDRRYVNAGLAALCNCSAFDWSARGRIARTPRAVPRLITMLSDVEYAPRASLTLLNLAEAPSNRAVMLVHEKQLVSHAMQVSPASETIASVLFDLSSA